MTKRESLNGKPYAENPHVWFDEGEAASTTSRRGSLRYKLVWLSAVTMANLAFPCLLSQQLYAYDYIWSPGSSLWLADTNWNCGEAWSDDNVAVFDGAVPADVEISGQVQAMDIKVSGTDYSFSGIGGIVMTNGFFDVAEGFTATVDVPISQPNDNSANVVNRFRKCGTGTLVIKANAVFDRYLHMAGDTVMSNRFCLRMAESSWSLAEVRLR